MTAYSSIEVIWNTMGEGSLNPLLTNSQCYAAAAQCLKSAFIVVLIEDEL